MLCPSSWVLAVAALCLEPSSSSIQKLLRDRLTELFSTLPRLMGVDSCSAFSFSSFSFSNLSFSAFSFSSFSFKAFSAASFSSAAFFSSSVSVSEDLSPEVAPPEAISPEMPSVEVLVPEEAFAPVLSVEVLWLPDAEVLLLAPVEALLPSAEEVLLPSADAPLPPEEVFSLPVFPEASAEAEPLAPVSALSAPEVFDVLSAVVLPVLLSVLPFWLPDSCAASPAPALPCPDCSEDIASPVDASESRETATASCPVVWAA